MFSELDEIKEITGVAESSCTCKECVQFCKTEPGLGTPTDILNLVNAGYAYALVPTKWAAGVKQNIPPISMIQPYFDIEKSVCIFLDEAGKKCILHDKGLKPMACRLNHHTLGELGVKMGAYLPIGHAVALTWTETEKCMPIMMEIINALKEYKEKNKPSGPST